MSILGLDLGTKTLGIAISKTGLISNPYTVLRYDNKNYEYLIQELKKIIEKEQIEKIILGLPKNMNNSYGFATERTLEFKKYLTDNFKQEVILVDERLSTKEAENILLANDMSRKKRKQVIDATAAMIILDTYLKMKGN